MSNIIELSIGRALLASLKKTLLVWIAVYPIALIALTFMGDLLRDQPLPLRALAATVTPVGTWSPAFGGVDCALALRQCSGETVVG